MDPTFNPFRLETRVTGAALGRFMISVFLVGLLFTVIGEQLESEKWIKSGMGLMALPLVMYALGKMGR